MTSPNSNFVSSIQNFSGATYYEAASGARFNPGDTDFAWSVLFWLNGNFHSADGAAVDRHFLFGNESGNDGWSLRIARGDDFSIADSANVPYLVAVLGTGSALRTASQRLALAPANPNLGTSSGFMKRLIQATGWYRATDNTLWLSVNGSVVALDTTAGTPGTSAAAPRIGLSPAGADAATYASVVGAAFVRDTLALTPARNLGLWAGEAWASARAGLKHGFISDPNSVDWTYRWEAEAAALGISGTITRSAAGGASLLTPPVAPAVLSDVGSAGRTNLAGSPPTKVAMNGAGVPVFVQERNPVWYAGAGAVQPPTV